MRRDLAHNMNVGVIERRLIDELDDDTDESIEGSPRRISAPEIATEMNNRLANHLRVSAERNGVDLGPRKDLAASLAEPYLAAPYLAAPYLAAPYLAEPYLRHKKRADSSGRENTFVADKVRELDVQATADAVLDLLNLEAEIIREGSDEPLCKKRRLLNNKMKVALAEGTRALLEISRDGMQLV